MSKIIVPQELVDQIIDLYKKGKTRKDIRQKLNLPFGDSVIKRILIESNIPIISNPGAQKGGRKKQEVSKEIQQQIIDLYVNKQYGLNKIVKELNLPFSFDKVKSILKENNIHIRTCAEANAITQQNTDFRKYSINDNYNFLSHNGAWILGFCAADGYLPKTKGATRRVTIVVSAIDKEILKAIKNELEYTGPIYEYDAYLDNKSYPTVALSFTSKNLRENFERYGVVNNKTFLLNSLPDLPDEFLIDYLRGYFDGDGSITLHYKNSQAFSFSITSANKQFLEEINNYLHSILPLKYQGSISKNHSAWSISWGCQDSIIIGKAFYDNDYLALSRKKNKFYNFLSLREQLPRA